jgi:hypothetical protein
MRGGTSKGVFLRGESLPPDSIGRDALLLAIMGSPDLRQIDGLGGATTRTSKIVILDPAADDSADINYTFGQVQIDGAHVSYAGNCGNLSAAVGAYAILEGYVRPVEPVTTVRVYNTNSKRILNLQVPVANGEPLVDGDQEIAGVPSPGAAIWLDFSATAGATTGRVLPTGNPRDRVFVPELGKEIEISIVDVAKATLFFHASDVGLRGTEGAADFGPDVLARIWAVQQASAPLAGIAPESGLPTPVCIAPAETYVADGGTTILESDVDLLARRVVGPPPALHTAFAATGAVCLGAAARIPGTVVNEVCRPAVEDSELIRIGHPSGVFPVQATVDADGTIRKAAFVRTARRLMKGVAFASERRVADIAALLAPAELVGSLS